MIRAALFDLGGTLYDYAALARAEAESLAALVRWAGVEAAPETILHAYRAALRRVFHGYLPRRFYLHRDLFRDAAVGMVEDLGGRCELAHLERYRALQWQLHRRDFVLRQGALETLQALRARGLGIGIVSNIDEDQLAHLAALGGFERHVDWMLSSERAGSCKPDPAIFAEAVRRAGCQPGDAVFVGDTTAQDVAGAKRAGLRAVLLWHRDERDPPDADPQPDHIIRRLPELLTLV